VGVVVAAAAAAASVAGVQAAATLWGGLWMLGGGDIVPPVPQVVRGKRIEGVGMDRRHLGDGVRVDVVSPCLALLPPFVFSPPLTRLALVVNYQSSAFSSFHFFFSHSDILAAYVLFRVYLYP